MKRNLFKKLAAAAGAAVMALTLVMPMGVSAAGETGSVTITKYTGTESGYEDISDTNNWGGSQTISGDHQLLNDVEFTCIKVGERHQIEVNSGGTIQTEMVYAINDQSLITVLGLTPGSDGIKSANSDDDTVYYRQSTLDTKIASAKTAVINYVKTYSGTPTKIVKPTAGQGTAVFDNLDLQSLYLFAETDSSNAKDTSSPANPVRVTSVSVPFFVSLPFTGKDGTEMKDIYAYPKNSTGEAKIDKQITTVETTTVNGGVADASIGDTITYKVTYSVPVGENGLQSLIVTDKMDDGLTFTDNADNITVVHKGSGGATDTTLDYGTNYTVEATPGTDSDVGKTVITIDFADYLATLNNSRNSTQKFEITYSAKLNDSAVLGQTGNKNIVDLEYENIGDTGSTEIPGNETTVYTYGIDLTKVGEKNAKLSDVEFTLEKETSDQQYKAVNVKSTTVGGTTCYVPDSNGTDNIVKTANAGKIYIRGLEEGTYKLTETKTNSGYVLLKEPVIIKITREDAGEATATVQNGSNTTTVTMTNDTLDSENSETALVPLTVVNNKGFDLPQTGAAGTAIFAIAGIVLVAVAGALLIFRRKTQK